jgi:hypothetical protein
LKSVRRISPDEALDIHDREGFLKDVHVVGEFHIPLLFPIEQSYRFANCVFDHYISSTALHAEPVEWDRCVFKEIEIAAGVYFIKGLICRDSEFLSEVLFDSGGHNSPETPILFERVKFHQFVDFWDCWFKGPIFFRDVEFAEGTNLLAEKEGYVEFEFPPVLENVKGTLDEPRNLPEDV